MTQGIWAGALSRLLAAIMILVCTHIMIHHLHNSLLVLHMRTLFFHRRRCRTTEQAQ